jgi:hypothetical protein
MTLAPFRLVIETAENGFLVYVNQDFSSGTIRPKPYVFENMQHLLEFVHKSFPEEKSAIQRMEEMYRPRS